MKELLVNSILISVIIIIFFYTRSLFLRSKNNTHKKNIMKKFSQAVSLVFIIFWVLVMITSIFHYYENIFMNLIVQTILTAIIIFIFYKKTKMTSKMFYSALQLLLTITVIGLLLLNSSTITNKSLFISKGDAITLDQIEASDILFLHSGSADILIPGYWSHIGLVIDNINNSVHVIESTTHGIATLTLSEFIGDGRVSVAKPKNIEPKNRELIIKFAKSKIGLPYNFKLLDKQIEGDSYYCSELIWASYQQAGIDIDKNPEFFLRYANAVAPQEIFGDDDLIIYHINKALKNEVINKT